MGAPTKEERIAEVIRRVTGPNLDYDLKKLADRHANIAVEHPHAKGEVSVHEGISHMTAMMHHSSKAQTAGTGWPPSIVTDLEGNQVVLWSSEEADDLLGPVTSGRSRISSAVNIVASRLLRLKAIALSDEAARATLGPDGGDVLATREAAAGQFERDLQDLYDANAGEDYATFTAALAEVDALAVKLPDDLDRLKPLLVERLEAHAMARIKFLRGAVSQQRIDMQAACNDMEQDEKTIALEEMVAQLEIMAAETVEEAKKEFDLGVLKINAVKAGRVPEFFNAADGEKFIVPVVTLNVATLTVLAKQPPMPQGRVAMVAQALPVINDDGTPRPFSATATVSKVPDKTDSKAVLVVQEGTAARFKLRAGNICGFTEIEIILVPPAA